MYATIKSGVAPTCINCHSCKDDENSRERIEKEINEKSFQNKESPIANSIGEIYVDKIRQDHARIYRRNASCLVLTDAGRS